MKGEAFSFKIELKIKQQQQQDSLGVCSDYYAAMIQRGKHTKKMKTSSRFAWNILIRTHIFTDNPDKPAALTALPVAHWLFWTIDLHCLCRQEVDKSHGPNH